MIFAVVLITVPVMGVLVAFDSLHCQARQRHSGG
jgi:hypothetical protein